MEKRILNLQQRIVKKTNQIDFLRKKKRESVSSIEHLINDIDKKIGILTNQRNVLINKLDDINENVDTKINKLYFEVYDDKELLKKMRNIKLSPGLIKKRKFVSKLESIKEDAGSRKKSSRKSRKKSSRKSRKKSSRKSRKKSSRKSRKKSSRKSRKKSSRKSRKSSKTSKKKIRKSCKY